MYHCLSTKRWNDLSAFQKWLETFLFGDRPRRKTTEERFDDLKRSIEGLIHELKQEIITVRSEVDRLNNIQGSNSVTRGQIDSLKADIASVKGILLNRYSTFVLGCVIFQELTCFGRLSGTNFRLWASERSHRPFRRGSCKAPPIIGWKAMPVLRRVITKKRARSKTTISCEDGERGASPEDRTAARGKSSPRTVTAA